MNNPEENILRENIQNAIRNTGTIPHTNPINVTPIDDHNNNIPQARADSTTGNLAAQNRPPIRNEGFSPPQYDTLDCSETIYPHGDSTQPRNNIIYPYGDTSQPRNNVIYPYGDTCQPHNNITYLHGDTTPFP